MNWSASRQAARRRFARALILTLLSSGCSGGADSSIAEQQEAAPIIHRGPFCLTTEYFPMAAEDSVMQYPLLRELGRQALLIAARDGLGMATRDETLGEPFPEDPNSRLGPLALRVRVENSCIGALSLREVIDSKESTNNLSELGDYKFDFQCDVYNLYGALSQTLATSMRTDLVTLLRQAGFEGQPINEIAAGPLSSEVEELLQQMSFVAQYDAARRTHVSITADGESPERLGGLVRAYAHLAMLTRHHWNYAHNVFAARSLLYAERLIDVARGGRLAYQHRAYARAMIGLHGLALQDLKRLPADNTDALPENGAATWTLVIEPFCRFERERLLALQDKEGLDDLVNHLVFDMVATFQVGRWNAEVGETALTKCPDAFDIYSEMAVSAPMGPQRQAVQRAAEVLARRAMKATSLIPGVPEEVIKLLQAAAPPREELITRALQGDPVDNAWSALPMQVAGALCACANDSPDLEEPSWAVLAGLITEEQFVEVVNYLTVSLNATESDKQPIVDHFTQLVENHRYAPYLKYFAAPKRPRLPFELGAKIHVVDPSPTMLPMIDLFESAHDADGKPYREHRTAAFWNHDYLLPVMLAKIRRVNGSSWQSPELLPTFKLGVEDVQWISPEAPTGLRLEILTTAEPSANKLAEWERRAKNDPIVWSKIAGWYYDRRDFGEAIRCYQRSYDLCPGADAAFNLAESHRDAGQDDRWLPALEAYLKEVDYGLGHAQIHSHIAKDHMANTRWRDAEPHALEAAQTWSSWGLDLASGAYEGMGRWEDSERWIRAAVEGYPSSSGWRWYLWCLRTGRGDIEQAKKAAEVFFNLDWVTNSESGAEYRFLEAMIDNKDAAALDHVMKVPEFSQHDYWQLHAVILAKRLGNEDLYDELKTSCLKLLSDNYDEHDPKYDELAAQLLSLRENGNQQHDVSDLQKTIAAFPPDKRCDYQYFAGEIVALAGDEAGAEQLWKAAVTGGPFDRYNATFAGQRLAAKYGVSRPDSEPSP